MYPYKLFWGLDLYSICIVIGIIGCMVIIRILSDQRGFDAKFQNFLLFNTVLAVFGGYGTAVLTQGLYNIARLGKFEITNSTGATFYGGLIGGIGIFLAVYFAAGHFLFLDGRHRLWLRDVSDIAACCITAAHGAGRIGCLMAGCCHGAVTDAWYGITMVYSGQKVVPVQLFEAIFLFAMSAVLIYMFVKGKRFQMPIYLFGYGIFRFFIEYLRDDERGQTIVEFLSPSQLTSILLMGAAIILLFAEMTADERRVLNSQDTEGSSDENTDTGSDEEM